MSERRYSIKPTRDFHVGRANDGRQVLLGLLCPEVVAYFFGADGTLVSVQRQPWRTPAARMSNDGPYQLHEPTFQAAIERQLSDLKTELGIADGTISVEDFFDEELFVGVEDVPEHLDEPEDDETPSERRERDAAREDWVASGKFVFWWAKDYWMTRDGDVEST